MTHENHRIMPRSGAFAALRQTKADLRRRMAALRDSIPPAEREAADRAIRERLLSLPEWRAARTVFLYVSFRSEVSTREILATTLETGRQLLVPRVDRARRVMQACRIGSLAELAPGSWGILEPWGRGVRVAAPEEIDLVVAPGLAFDRCGRRLGYGAGYYDRYLRRVRPDCVRVALAYDIQVLPEIPTHSRDQRLQLIVTETRAHLVGDGE